MKNFLIISLVFFLSACTQKHTGEWIYPFNASVQHTAPSHKSVHSNQLYSKTVPIAYWHWLSQPSHKVQAARYQAFLKQHNLLGIIPEFELFQTARDWQSCGASEYEIPPQEIWNNIVPTLTILKKLVEAKVIDDFTVTSVYRNYNLNRCSRGVDSSRHVFNAALDFRIGSEQPSSEELWVIQQTKNKLCQFWAENGEALNMGLGVYASGQIHIDSVGYRTWGPDHHRMSSPCVTQLLSN
ncbi:D-Ala-D-Ala carboxypeptidase family metallohydrolase [Acinetobacter lactucae]|uniref:D-Ala-D-Ala carboxypeptidase family metallohydrolase n=1 Tax=Acinetobacter lactucae TaxID=1785128 RepID=UPI001580E2E0|nr:D-Ala-D-Ala carboxypeptidase family metallohydrolase [Acinetobacter lactucae]NUF38371.1 peptidase M15 [Acinetobacter lactucae]